MLKGLINFNINVLIHDDMTLVRSRSILCGFKS